MKDSPNWTPPLMQVRPENIPADLRAYDRWIIWKWEKRTRDGQTKWDKPPRRIDGNLASVMDPDHLSSFDEAYAAYRKKGYSGIGIVLPDSMVGIDLDSCKVGGELIEEARSILAGLDTYAEWSPSGEGLKAIGRGKLDPNLPKTCRARGIELYDGGQTNRYFTVTGHVIDEAHSTLGGVRRSVYGLQCLMADPISPPGESEAQLDTGAFHRALDCLRHLSKSRADDYAEWINVGMALHAVDRSDEMLAKWTEWSSQSSKFDGPETCRLKWESFRRSSGRMLTGKYLERIAREDGYKPNQYQTFATPATELCAKSIHRDFLIRNMLVKDEPMVIGGASKSLKTSVALDMAVSIATGTPFLGHPAFAVSEPRRVLMISGESGEATIQDTLRRIAESKGLEWSELSRLEVSFRLPKLDDPGQVEDLIDDLQARDCRTVFVDPLYRSLRAGDAASNVYAMGERLEQIAEKISRHGITVILLHHFRKTGRTYSEPPDLEDLSQSGVAEFGRQFLLLKRREAYRRDGNHTLWFQWGGSAGHQGEMMLEACTGTWETGTTWRPTLKREEDWREEQEAKRKVQESEARSEDQVLEDRVLEVLTEFPGTGVNEMVEILKVKKTRLTRVLQTLEDAERVTFLPGPRSSKLYHVLDPILGESEG